MPFISTQTKEIYCQYQKNKVLYIFSLQKIGGKSLLIDNEENMVKLTDCVDRKSENMII